MTTARTGRVAVGVVGAGVISAQYLANLTAFPDLDVLFVADLDEERARAAADRFGLPGARSVAELLADDRIEVVVNLTVPQAHVEVALRAIAAGKHVWSEKPFALDRASGRRLLAAAHDAGLRVATAPDTFLGAGIQSARRVLETGRIGAPLTALTLMQTPGPDLWHPNPGFLFSEGGGPLFDIGPYYLTALVQLLGPVARVSAAVSTAQATRTVRQGPLAGETFPVTVPTHVGALYSFAGGQSAQCVFSFDSALKRTLFEVTGVDGTLVVPDPNTFAGELLLHERGGQVVTLPATGSTATRGVGVLELARAIRAGQPERASGELAYHVLDVMSATIEAGDTGRPVEVGSTVDLPATLPAGWDPTERTLDG